MSDPNGQFRDAIQGAGLTPPDTILDDGAIHRFSASGKPRDDSGWYMFHSDGIPAGAFGCWRAGLQSTWCAKSDTSMTSAERDAHRRRIDAMKLQRDAETSERQAAAAVEATRRNQAAKLCTQHGYLTTKCVQAHGLRVDTAGALLVPMRDTAGILHSLQSIAPDGEKRFMPGGRVKGCYHSIGRPDGAVIVCEGYATGASIHEATGQAVAVAFNAGNLNAVAMVLHKKYPALAIVIAADDDHKTNGNPGLTSAKSAALAVGGFVVAPQFPAGRPAKATDFNDLAAIAGPGAVRACFAEVWEFVC